MKETFLFNPGLPFVRRDYPGNRLVNGRFVNEDGIGPVGYGKLFKWLFSANPQRAEKKSDTFRLPFRPDEAIFSSEEDAFSWLGHASFLFRLRGKLLLTDPCLSDLPGGKRLVAPPFSFEKLRGVDYVLFTHTHRDHFDVKSVKQLLAFNPGVHFLVPLKMRPLLEALGAKNVTEAGWFQQYDRPFTQGIEIVFLPAKHWNRRFLHDTNRELWGSFLLRTANQTIYFAGDTAAAGHFETIAELFPAIDHVFMPVGAYKPNYVMKDAHISPEEAVGAFHTLRAKTFIPMHFGTYDLADEPPGEPLRLLRQYKKENKLQGELLTPAIGEHVRLSEVQTK